METAKKFLQFLLETIVDNPKAIVINTKNDEMGILFSIHVAPEDMGRIIGKQGRTASAIRELLNVMGYKARAHLAFKLEEPEGSQYRIQL